MARNARSRGGEIADAMKQTIINNGVRDIVKKTSQEDHIYYNIVITNTSSTSVQPAVFNQSRTTAILENPSEYYCAIQRFTVPLQQVPIFIFLDNTYSVTLSNGATDYQTFLTYVPGYTPNLTPGPPENRFVYSYNQFIDSINNALGISMTNLTAGLTAYNPATTYAAGNTVSFVIGSSEVAYTSIVSGNIGHTPNTSPAFWAPLSNPYMAYDPVTELISLYVSTGWHNAQLTDQTQTLKIWFNTLLWNFFTNFEKIFNGYTPTSFNANGKNYNIIVKPTGINDITIPAIYEDFGVDISGYAMSQEFVTLYDWNALRNIVFFTSTIPIRNEGIPANIFAPWNISTTYNAGVRISYSGSTYSSLVSSNIGNQPDISPAFWAIVQNIASSSSYQPILTDFQILITNGTEARSYAQFFPSGEYRLIDMTGTTPMTNIDIQVYWQDKFQQLYPLYINPLDSLDMKILFRKKSLKGSLSYYN
jgi:hypothetical protein